MQCIEYMYKGKQIYKKGKEKKSLGYRQAYFLVMHVLKRSQKWPQS